MIKNSCSNLQLTACNYDNHDHIKKVHYFKIITSICLLQKNKLPKE
jgi:hypothetical protein